MADGYARNFLLKKNLAQPATVAALEMINIREEKKKKLNIVELKNHQQMATTLDGVDIEISGKASEESTLYAAIGGKKIVDEIKRQFGVDVKLKQIIIPKAIKDLGDHKIKIEFGHGLEAELNVVVSPE